MLSRKELDEREAAGQSCVHFRAPPMDYSIECGEWQGMDGFRWHVTCGQWSVSGWVTDHKTAQRNVDLCKKILTRREKLRRGTTLARI